MKKILLGEKAIRVVKNRRKLEQNLGIKITNRGKEFFIEGNPLDEYTAEKVLEALDFGFPFSVAMLLKEEEDFIFEILNIKDHTKRKDFPRIRSRIIGKGGKALKTLNHLTKCYFELKDNEVGIIGDSENMENAEHAIVSIIKGAKHSNVYNHLEKNHPAPISDLGLKR
jgi:ribosomal RNA assembly protein